MKKTMLALLLAASLSIMGCASNAPSLSDEVQNIEHQFVLSSDDPVQRNGANPTHVLIERPAGGQWRVIAIAKSPIERKSSNQEELLVSHGYTNVVPEWDSYSVEFKEDPKTGKRYNYAFTTSGGKYTPKNSAFAFEIGNTAAPTLSGWRSVVRYGLATNELRKAISQSNLLDETRAFNEQRKKFPNSAPDISPMRLSNQVWMITPNYGGDLDRYYFVPTNLKTANGEYVEANSSLYAVSVKVISDRVIPFEEVRHFKIYSRNPPSPRNELGCAWAIIDLEAGKQLDERFCGYAVSRGEPWGMPLRARSPNLGEVKVLTIEGQAYDLRGNKTQKDLKFDVERLSEFRNLSGAEAKKAMEIFH